MPVVRLAEQRVWVDDQPRALLSGEVHYWRLDPEVWPRVLQRVGELGLDIVSTYVCWEFHELSRGEFDFTGRTNPRRDLLGFLQLVHQAGYWVVLRPGPYLYAEWPNSGVPERVVGWHRLHPSFREEARVWMRGVVEAVRDRLATGGGPIVLVQDFLRTRYTRIGELNAAWGADYADVAQARAVVSPAFPAYMPRYLDVCRFRHWYATEVVRWTAEAYRQLGVDVPITANTYAGTREQDWRAIESVVDLAGPDLYPTARLADDPDEHRGVLDAIRYARSYSRLPFIPEFESGIWHGWHLNVGALDARHYELLGLSALQAGAAGWNWYMLASRDSWYMSPITELGRFRPELAPTFAELVRLFRAVDPSSLEKVTQTAVTFNALERGSGLDTAGREVVRALYAADVDYDFFDLDSGMISRPLVLYGGGPHVSAAQIERLVASVEAGGTLVLFQPPVIGGLAGAPVAVGSAAAPQRLRVRFGEARPGVELGTAAVFVYAEMPGAQPIVAERIAPWPPTQEGGHAHVQLPVGERLTVGYAQSRGRGRVIVLGLAPSAELMVELHAWLGVRVACRARSGQRVTSALFRRGAMLVVVVTNTGQDDRDVVLDLDGEMDDQLRASRDLRTGVVAPVVGGSVLARVPARSGTVLELS